MTPRLATPADATACADILNGWIDRTPWMPRIHAPDGVQAFYETQVLPKRRVWVAGTPVAGFLALDTDAACVTALYTATPGKGLGAALLDCAKAGQQMLELWTFKANTRARAFYAREGFSPVRETDGDNEEGLPDVLLRWRAAT